MLELPPHVVALHLSATESNTALAINEVVFTTLISTLKCHFNSFEDRFDPLTMGRDLSNKVSSLSGGMVYIMV